MTPLFGYSGINFYNYGNNTVQYSIENVFSNYMYLQNKLNISNSTEVVQTFSDDGTISFPKVKGNFYDNGIVLFGELASTLRGSFNINDKLGATHAVFGNDYAGVSIESDWPGISLNGYFNSDRKPITDGFVGGINMDPSSGKIMLYNSSVSGTKDSPLATINRLFIDNEGDLGIGINDPIASLDVARGTGVNGTAAFRGTSNTSHFNYSTGENSYVRGGKVTSDVYINDTGNNVAIGNVTPQEKLHVTGNIRSSNLAGTGSRNVYADANGTLTTTAKTSFLSIPSEAFVETSRDKIQSTYNNMIRITSGNLGKLIAPVFLPQGAVITSVNFIYLDNEPGKDIKVTFGRRAGINPPFALEEIASATETTNNASERSVVDNSISNAVVDNQNYYYALEVACMDNVGVPIAWTTNMGFRGVVITYSY